MNLDTAAAFMTPIMLYAARGLGADEEPFLYGAVLMANAASLYLPGSNLTNLLVEGGQVSGLDFLSAHLARRARRHRRHRRRPARLRRQPRPDSPQSARGGLRRRSPSRPGRGARRRRSAAVLVVALREPALPVLAAGSSPLTLTLDRQAHEAVGPPP